MIITPLGHTEFLVDILNDSGENVRILVDTWLSGYAVGDLMERSVQVELDPEKLSTIDAIYISHSHTDHLDPYTLMEIYRHASPTLIVPFTLAYLTPLFREYLGGIDIIVLTPEIAYSLRGIDITGYMFPQSEITNEDDVMMLSISNGLELLFAEIDTLPEEDHLEAQKKLFSILSENPYETVCYLASRNELAGQIPYIDLALKKRKAFRDEYIANRKEEMYFSYQKWEYEEYESFPNIYEIPNFVRGYIGQGIRYPSVLSSELAGLQIFPLDEIASMESDIARSCGYEFQQKALLPGRQYRIEKGTIEVGRKECPIGELIKNGEQKGMNTSISSSGTEGRIHVPESPLSSVPQDDGKIRLYASGPLFPRVDIDLAYADRKILEMLNHRFLPYWSASPIASLRSELIKSNDGCYRIGFQVSVMSTLGDILLGDMKQDFSLHSKGQEQWIIFEYSFASFGFKEVTYFENMKLDEDYWLDDILDFFNGRQELYSNFWHKLDPRKIYRLWMCLGANFMNYDLVEQKYRLHFERAKRGETSESFFDEMKGNLFRK